MVTYTAIETYLLGILVCLSAGDLAVHGANFLLVHMSRVPVLLGSLLSVVALCS